MALAATSRPAISARRMGMWLLLFVAAACGAWVGAVRLATWYVQATNEHLLEDQLRASAQPGGRAASGPITSGRLELTRVGLRAMVLEGDDETTLRVAVGHIPGTAWPGEHGHAAFAGHRDTFFRPLRDVRIGDEIRFTSAAGVYRYRVTETRVVGARDVHELAPGREPLLTLITCYPFSYAGTARSRYLVRAVPLE